MEIKLKYAEIVSGVEILAAYRGAKRVEGGADYDRVRILEGLDDEVIRIFISDGAAELYSRSGLEVSVGGEETDRDEGDGQLRSLALSFMRLYVLGRWYSKLRVEEWTEVMGRADMLCGNITSRVENIRYSRKVRIARRRRLPPIG